MEIVVQRPKWSSKMYIASGSHFSTSFPPIQVASQGLQLLSRCLLHMQRCAVQRQVARGWQIPKARGSAMQGTWEICREHNFTVNFQVT